MTTAWATYGPCVLPATAVRAPGRGTQHSVRYVHSVLGAERYTRVDALR